MTLPKVTVVAAVVAFMLVTGCSTPPGPDRSGCATAGLERLSYAAPALGDMRVSYLRGGTSGGRRVIFVHGTPGEAAGWTDFLLNAPAGFEYIAVDRPGFGCTLPAAAQPSIERQALAIAPLLTPSGGDFPILVGHSLGGPIIARVAADQPGRVEALVILAGSLDPALEKIHPMQRVGEWWGVRALLPKSLRNANRELLPLKRELEGLAPLLGGITVPVTIIHGTADTLVPVANVAFMQARFTRSAHVRTLVLPGQNHFLPWEHRPTIERAIADLASR